MPEYTPELRAEVDAAIDWMTAPKPLALGANQHQDLADIATWLRSVDSAKARLAGFAPALTAHIDAQAAEIARLREALAKSEDAMSEMFRYYDGGETRGSYDGKPERAQLRTAWRIARAALNAKDAA